MDAAALAGSAMMMQQALVQTQVQTALLKQTADLEAQTATLLLEGAATSAPPPAADGRGATVNLSV